MNWLQNEVIHIFREVYNDSPVILRSAISKIKKQFRENGHIINKQVINMSALNENPHVSTMLIAMELEISHPSVKIILSIQKFILIKWWSSRKLTEHSSLANNGESTRQKWCKRPIFWYLGRPRSTLGNSQVRPEIVVDLVIGPIFFQIILNGDGYLEFWQ